MSELLFQQPDFCFLINQVCWFRANQSVGRKSSHELCGLVKISGRKARNLGSLATTARNVWQIRACPAVFSCRGSSCQQCSPLLGFLFIIIIIFIIIYPLPRVFGDTTDDFITSVPSISPCSLFPPGTCRTAGPSIP